MTPAPTDHHTPHPGPPRPARRLMAAVGSMLAGVALAAFPAAGAQAAASHAAPAASAAPAAPSSAGGSATPAATTLQSVTLAGHGWGHGRGLGQWGALGYALQGQSYGWILDHYYGGTHQSTVANGPIRVRLVANDGRDLIVTSTSRFTAAGQAVAAGGAVLMHLAGGHVWQISRGPGCAGPWTPSGTARDDGTGVAAAAQPPSSDPGAPSSALLRLCVSSGTMTLRGSLVAAEVAGVARTVDVLPLESYLRGVVASESPASWGSVGAAGAQGRPQGFQALEAQAVAARSYAVADQRSGSGSGLYGYADICDSTACQVYRGVAGESSSSDAAVAATAGQVRSTGGGAIATTEFSSSTGGWTAGGAFPAVEDAGDSVCSSQACNPNHSWTTAVTAASVQSLFPAIGSLVSVTVTDRSGPAQVDMGGRATQVVLQGTAGSQTVSGATLAADLGLRSDWFAPVSSVTGGGSDSGPGTTTTTTGAPSRSGGTTTTTAAGGPSPTVSGAVSRLAGPDRDHTAVVVSQATFKAGTAGVVVLARSDQFADALAGAALAGARHGPLLLTPSDRLDPAAAAEMRRVLPPGGTVVLLGGTGALSDAVGAGVTSAGLGVQRIAGADRYETAAAVAGAAAA
ncbi:MAG TPA: cell wall-binding repeat-containing protein, partial [Acidimicrobiales bacterium]|nr:cell wall-binding repeat-containing protein [Acidimicrobiales bacterium]